MFRVSPCILRRFYGRRPNYFRKPSPLDFWKVALVGLNTASNQRCSSAILLFAVVVPEKQADDKAEAPGAKYERARKRKSKPRNDDESNRHKCTDTIARNGDGPEGGALRHDKLFRRPRLTFQQNYSAAQCLTR